MSDKPSFFRSAAGKWTLAAGAILALGVGVSVADWARDGGGPRWGRHGGQATMGMERGARVQRLCERDPLRFEGVVRAFVKADLDLKPEQVAELDKLASALVPALKEVRDEVCSNFAQRSTQTTAPERLQKFSVVLRKAADAAEKAVAPTQAFYAKLDDKQKARVEEIADRRHGRGFMGGGHHMGPGGPGMMGPGTPQR